MKFFVRPTYENLGCPTTVFLFLFGLGIILYIITSLINS